MRGNVKKSSRKMENHHKVVVKHIRRLQKELKPKKLKRVVEERIRTGIPGLDKLLQGGFPTGSLILVTGGPGSGKTLFGLQFIYEGVVKYDEPGLFISLEEPPKRLIKNAQQFGWDFKPLIREKKVTILKTPMYRFSSLLTAIDDAVSKLKVKRVVIDPAAVLHLFFKDRIETRKGVIELAELLKRFDCTSVITSDSQIEGGEVSSFGVEEYAADGVVTLYHTRIKNAFVRMLAIIKMRGTKHSQKIHPFEISEKGLRLFPR